MREVKTTLSRMAFYYLLLAINVLPCGNVIPDSFPTRNLSAFYLLILSVCLVLYYAQRLTPGGSLSRTMKALSWTALLLILLRGVKYSAFSEVGVWARHVWYLYYMPTLQLPLFLFHVSLLVSAKSQARITLLRRLTLAATLVLIALVLTNDLHQAVFRFAPEFRDWDRAYSYGPLFYAITLWQYALYLAAILILVIKCRVGSARRAAWILLIPFAIGIAMNALLLTGRMPKLNGSFIIEFPEALIFMAAVVLEGCMQLGLIPTNANYGTLFPLLSIRAQITDPDGSAVYVSRAAVPLTGAQFALPDGARLDGHTVLHRIPIPGGFGFWQDDLTELDRLNEELTEAGESLAQEAELARLRNELTERQAGIEQRTLVYDAIARRTQRQSQAISRLAKSARLSSDAAYREDCRSRIALLGAYIKRYANLTLLSQECSVIEAGELGLSVSEVLRYLNFSGIPGELVNRADCLLPAQAALAAFEAFELLLEAGLTNLKGVFVNLSEQTRTVRFKITLEGLSEPLGSSPETPLADAGISLTATLEDGVSYVCLTLPKGGRSA